MNIFIVCAFKITGAKRIIKSFTNEVKAEKFCKELEEKQKQNKLALIESYAYETTELSSDFKITI